MAINWILSFKLEPRTAVAANDSLSPLEANLVPATRNNSGLFTGDVLHLQPAAQTIWSAVKYAI